MTKKQNSKERRRERKVNFSSESLCYFLTNFVASLDKNNNKNIIVLINLSDTSKRK